VRRPRGFSLVELLVSLALAGLVLAGAFQLHLSFNRQAQRQQQIAELQQTLRVAMQLLERAVRSAGQGLPSTHALPAMVGGGCTAVSYYGFQFSNDNTYNDPKTTFWDPTIPDRDPDWFRVIASDDGGDGTATYAGCNGVNVDFLAETAQRWRPGDLFLVIPDVTQPPSACALACTHPYEVTSGFAGTPTQASPGTIKNQHGGASCYNPPPGLDGCLSGNGRPNGCAGPGSTMRHFSGGGTVYRVMTSADQGDATGYVPPKLAMRTAPFGTPFSDATYTWIPLADGIEDLQLAVILADGTVCNSVDDPAACNFANAVAVRMTLVGRTASSLQGVPQSPLGGYEDEPATTPAAGSLAATFLRRSMTSTVQLRSYAP
jgi:prepilin-type N-terminal cleavage/methylation domain-containing protein